MILTVKCGVRTHAHFRVPELKSGALDRSANLTHMKKTPKIFRQTDVQMDCNGATFFHV